MRSSRNLHSNRNVGKDGCNRLENAVKPQLPAYGSNVKYRCNRLENAVKPQQTTLEIRTWPDVSAYIKRDQAASMVNKANIAAWTQQIKKCGQAATKSVNH